MRNLKKQYNLSTFFVQSIDIGPVIFTNRKGESLTRQDIRYIMRKYATESKKSNPDDFSGSAHPHLLHHSKATHLVNAGMSIYNVRDFLGHASVATTQVYLTSNPKVIRKAIENVASQTVPNSAEYYSADEKQSFMEFLDTLI